jgi:hypothetical protein
MRSLLSEGEITYRIAERGKEGRFITRKITKHGPVNVILTTTATSLHPENESRMLSLPTDGSSARCAGRPRPPPARPRARRAERAPLSDHSTSNGRGRTIPR